MAKAKKDKKDIPADVKRYVEEHKAQGNDEGKAWALAWSRYCEYKNPGSDHCQKTEYFSGRKAALMIDIHSFRKLLGG